MLQHRSTNFKLDYCEIFLTKDESIVLFNTLSSILPIKKKRTAWLFGDDFNYQVETKNYTMDTRPEPWLSCLIPIKEKLEKFIYIQYGDHVKFNVCVIQQYPNGKFGINPHRDKEMMPGTMICGISLGQQRNIVMSKYKTEVLGQQRNIVMSKYKTEVLTQPLKNGSLYVLLPPTNDFYAHSIPKDDSLGVRFSLTFRNKTI